MIVTHELTMDLLRPGADPRIHAVQGDVNTRVVEITLTEAGEAYAIPAGTAAVVRYRKEDGTGGVYGTLPDGSLAYSISGNTVRVYLVPQVLSCSGFVTASVALSNGGCVLGIFSFRIQVEADPSVGTVESENYFSYDSLEEINAVLAGLQSGKAPAGFGLGGGGTWIASGGSANTLTNNGWYAWPAGGVTDTPFVAGYMLVAARSPSKHITQIAMDGNYSGQGKTRICIRTIGSDGIAGAWEWLNPPMDLGVEYRTTERWNGKAVYTKLINFGSMPNSGTGSISHGISGITQVVRCIGQNITDAQTIPSNYGGNYAEIYADKNRVYIYCTSNASLSQAYAQLWYTKD